MVTGKWSGQLVAPGPGHTVSQSERNFMGQGSGIVKVNLQENLESNKMRDNVECRVNQSCYLECALTFT